MSNDGKSFILAGGPSLLQLSEAEKAYLNAHPNTLALNKFLMYWELVGVLPQALMINDHGRESKILTMETLRLLQAFSHPVALYWHEYYRDFFAPLQMLNLKATWGRVQYRYQFWRESRYWLPLSVSLEGATDIQVSYADSPDKFFWANSLQEALYHYRGSLTVAINLASILYPNCDIYLLGVDMNSYSAFYELPFPPNAPSRYEAYRQLTLVKQTAHHQQSRAQNIHVTAGADDGKPPLQAVVPTIIQHLSRRGVSLYNANPDSLLVTQGLTPYRAILGN